jgi:hypothetical protein
MALFLSDEEEVEVAVVNNLESILRRVFSLAHAQSGSTTTTLDHSSFAK